MSTYFGFYPSNRSDAFFISYNSEDAKRIAPIVKKINDYGIPLWYDYGLEFGREWEAQIAEHIHSCRAVVMFITRNLMQREGTSYVRIEYDIAREDYGKTVYAVMLDNLSSSEVIQEHKVWWRQLVSTQCITSQDALEIINAITSNTTTPLANNKFMSPEEMNTKGVDYFNGRNGVQQDYAQAVKYFRYAAEQDNLYGQYNMGLCYENGYGLPKDCASAVKYYRLSANQGYVSAQKALGVLYDTGSGVPQDHSQAAKYFRLAADQGNMISQRYLANYYYNGKGVDQDYAQAAKYYRLAADQGDAYAQYMIGFCLHNGQGVAQDYAQAVKYFHLSADQGNMDATFCLGVCYGEGQGVEKDYDKSERYFRLASENGDQIAAQNLKVIGRRKFCKEGMENLKEFIHVFID